MAYYPIMLEMNGRSCVVVGGGDVAARKVEGLLAAGGTVRVVSPALVPSLESLRDAGRIEHVARDYAEGDLAGFEICVIATDDGDVNAAAVREARSRRIWLNVVDSPHQCDFILPSVIRRGDVVLGISTSGASPAFARWLRERLEAYVDDSVADLARLFANVRRDVRERDASLPDPELWQQAVDDELLDLVAKQQLEEAESLLRARLGLIENGPKGRVRGA